VQTLLNAGYPYEIAGLVYYIFFLLMLRKGQAQRFSQRSRVLTLLAAIALVACVPLHYAAYAFGVVLMLALAVAALISTLLDGVRR
jgi:hypothetical protein